MGVRASPSGTISSYIEHGILILVFDQRGELPLLPFGNPIGPSTLLRMVSLSNHFVPASRGGVYPVPQNTPCVIAGINPVR